MANQDGAYKLLPKTSDAREVYIQQLPNMPDKEGYTIKLPAGQDHVWIGAVNAPHARAPFNYANAWDDIGAFAWAVCALIVLAAGFAVVRGIYKNTINLAQVVSEPDGKASLARFQALIFTFVFLIAFILVVMKTGDFPTEIPGGVLAILAGSAGTFLASKYMTPKGAYTPIDPGLSRVLWCEPNLSLCSKAATACLNTQQSTVSVTLPVKPSSTGPGTVTDYMVVAVLAGKVKVAVTPIRSSDAKGQVYMRFKGNVTGPIGTSQTLENTDCGEISELAAAAFGGEVGESIKLEIRSA